MKLPFVSRSSYEELERRCAAAEETVERLQGEILALARQSVGLPRDTSPRRKPEQPIPPELRKMIAGFENPLIRHRLADEARRAHAAGKPWNLITQQLEESVS